MPEIVKIDRFLILGIKEGDKHAFDALFMAYHHQIFLYCLNFTKSKEVSEEIMQDTFITIWKKRTLIDVEQSLEGLLFKISKDLSLNYLKKVLREKCFMETMHALHTFSQNFTENSVASNECYHIATEAINNLPAKQRMIFKMNRFMGFSYETIADKLGISKNTVKVQLVRANKSLKKVFAAYGLYL